MSDALRPSRIRLRPRHHTVHISRGRTVLGMDHAGTIDPANSCHGLYVYQTRMLSRYCWSLQGKQPHTSTQSAVQQHSWLGYFYDAPPNCKDTPSGECNPLQETVGLKISRVVGEGMHEDVEVTNHTQVPTSVVLALDVDADFAARTEIEKGREQHGDLRKSWGEIEDGWRWRFDYHVQHHYDRQGNVGTASLQRAIALRLRADSAPSPSENKLTFHINLQPHQKWHACLIWQAEVDGKQLPVETQCNALTGSDYEYHRKTQSFLSQATFIKTPVCSDLSALVESVLDRSRSDLAALRLFDLDDGPHSWKLAAGVPTYMAVFGRDMMAASWQASLLSPELSWGAVRLMESMQSHEMNDWRDAQPGRMVHESHTDPLSELNFRPQSLYYGTANASFLYPILISELWHWTGDKEGLQPYIRPALEALAWADKYSRDASGFYKYKTRSMQGLKNQGWKDSSDAIVYPDGAQVDDPIGTCEMQAFAYASKLHLSEVLWWFNEVEQARRLYREAEELKQRFNEKFWLEEEGYVAMAIDSSNTLVKSISSDAGHCLLSGILHEGVVPRVANRMMQPDLFSGWGIRTLSSAHAAYNPFAYHRGTVWPVENGGFVLGMARYGLHGEMWRLARALFEAAHLFDYDRLPEVFGGHARDEAHPFPGLYERADSPQAWSASVPFMVIQALTGIYPYAPLKVLFLDPWLPEWLPEVTIDGMQVGDARVTLRFRRGPKGKTDFKIEQLEGELHVLRQPSPWSLTSGWGERVKDAVSSLLHAA